MVKRKTPLGIHFRQVLHHILPVPRFSLPLITDVSSVGLVKLMFKCVCRIGARPASFRDVQPELSTPRNLFFFLRALRNQQRSPIMRNSPRTLQKGGYTGNQNIIVRFRASAGLYEKLQEMARQQGLCLAALVRKLVITGHEKFKL